jgi:hypothetical protein
VAIRHSTRWCEGENSSDGRRFQRAACESGIVAWLQWRQWGSAALHAVAQNVEAGVAVGAMWAALAAR